MKNPNTLRTIISASFIFIFCIGFSQDKKASNFNAEISLDIVSSYVWRGIDYQHNGSLQPYLALSWKNTTIGAWGAYKFGGKGENETDLFVSQKIGPLTFTLYDYWSYNDSLSTDFFDYKHSSTGHMLEAIAEFSMEERFPLTFMVGYLFYGADAGKTLYLQAGYNKQTEIANFEAFIGYQATGTYYAERPAFVNFGIGATKELKISKSFGMDLGLNLVFNPVEGKTFLVAKLSI